jgi:hypothetical protein
LAWPLSRLISRQNGELSEVSEFSENSEHSDQLAQHTLRISPQKDAINGRKVAKKCSFRPFMGSQKIANILITTALMKIG